MTIFNLICFLLDDKAHPGRTFSPLVGQSWFIPRLAFQLDSECRKLMSYRAVSLIFASIKASKSPWERKSGYKRLEFYPPKNIDKARKMHFPDKMHDENASFVRVIFPRERKFVLSLRAFSFHLIIYTRKVTTNGGGVATFFPQNRIDDENLFLWQIERCCNVSDSAVDQNSPRFGFWGTWTLRYKDHTRADELDRWLNKRNYTRQQQYKSKNESLVVHCKSRGNISPSREQANKN